EQINSIPDAVGTAMRRYLDGEVDKAYPDQATLEQTTRQEDDPEVARDDEPEVATRETDGGAAGAVAPSDADTQSLIDSGESPECPECNSMTLYYSEGCKTCETCGWSEC
ncbi:ribonucleoside-diphosphate reductase, adenosylcobalamin-dependent, partial [Halobacteriales archaeon QS_4_69_225]